MRPGGSCLLSSCLSPPPESHVFLACQLIRWLRVPRIFGVCELCCKTTNHFPEIPRVLCLLDRGERREEREASVGGEGAGGAAARGERRLADVRPAPPRGNSHPAARLEPVACSLLFCFGPFSPDQRAINCGAFESYLIP